jgi:hypothetical protein
MIFSALVPDPEEQLFFIYPAVIIIVQKKRIINDNK